MFIQQALEKQLGRVELNYGLCRSYVSKILRRQLRLINNVQANAYGPWGIGVGDVEKPVRKECHIINNEHLLNRT
jgi:hypothetical protein